MAETATSGANGGRSESSWTFLPLTFTLTFVVIAVVGSIWVMYHLDRNMIPMSPHEALHKPLLLRVRLS